MPHFNREIFEREKIIPKIHQKWRKEIYWDRKETEKTELYVEKENQTKKNRKVEKIKPDIAKDKYEKVTARDKRTF